MRENLPLRIAIADDHPSMLDGLIFRLRTLPGFTICIAAVDGKDLIDKIASSALKPHICILDVRMPVMDGFAALAEIRDRWPEIKNIMHSILGNEDFVRRAILSGANACLSKSCDLQLLQRTLEEVASMGKYYPKEIHAATYREYKDERDVQAGFSAREIQLFPLLATDLSYADIGRELHIPHRSVETIKDALCKKLTVNSRSSLILKGIQLGYIPIDDPLPD